MDLAAEYRLSRYQDLGKFSEKEHIHLMRNMDNGLICVRKTVPEEMMEIYSFLKENDIPHIPEIYECIAYGDSLIILEEYISGENLEERVEYRRFSLAEALVILEQLCDCLTALHGNQPPVICRDLKASNIMLTADGQVKLIDFDIARTYQEGLRRDTRIMGTEGYAAPEQFGFRQTDARTDIFAMGVLLNFLLTGKNPVDETVPGKAGEVVRRCTMMNPEERYQSAAELKRALKKLEKVADFSGGRKPAVQDQTDLSEGQRDSGNELAGMDRRQERAAQISGENSAPWYIFPGFRSRTPWKMLTAVLGYLCVSVICFTMDVTVKGVAVHGVLLWLNRIMLWLSQIAWLFLACDYQGLRQKFPLLQSPRRILRLLGLILAEGILLVIAAVICVIAEYFL